MDNLMTFLSSGSAAAGTTAGLACAAKAACVLAGAALASFSMRGRAAATRHLVWCLGLAGALALLPLAVAMPRWGLPILSASAESQSLAARSSPAASPEQDDRPATQIVASTSRMKSSPRQRGDVTEQEAASRIDSRAAATPVRAGRGSWPLLIWVTGTVAVLAWCAIGWVTTRRLGRIAQRVTDPLWLNLAGEAAGRLKVAPRVALLRGGPAAMPLTWGFVHPVVLLPAEADLWPPERRRAVLLHELAHVRRRDCLTQWLGLATCAMYWFNPLAWWAMSRLRSEREQACDDLVLEAGERPSSYAAELLGVARSLRPVRARAPAAMAMARPSGLERRLLAILDARCNRRRPARSMVAACLVAVLAASATLAAVRLVAREEPKPVISGLVVGPDGKPLNGATVVVVASRPAELSPMEHRRPAAMLGQARSNAQGQFRIELADQSVKADSRLFLVVTARGTSFQVRKLDDLASRVPDPIRLNAEQPLEIRLVDLEGSPIAGAEVQLGAAYPSSTGEGLSSETLTKDSAPVLAAGWTSDANGRFSPRGVGSDQWLSFEVRASGFGNQRLEVQTKAGVRTVTLALGRGHLIEGRVTLGEGGPPAVGALVKARSMSEKEGIGLVRGAAETTTAADGRYRIEVSPGGGIRMEVFPPREGADAFLLRGKLVVPGESVASHVDFALPEGVLVRGRVTSAGTGQPVAGAVVHHQAHERNNPYYIKGTADWFNGDEQKAITQADGTFWLGVMPGPGYLLVKGPTPDYLHEEISTVELEGQLIWPNTRNYPDALRKLDLKPSDGPIDVDLNLRRGTTVRGHIIGADGQPARDAVVFCRWYLPLFKLTINHGQNVLPARGGRFELGSCDASSSAPAFFLDARKQQGAVVELSGKQAGSDLEVKLQPCGSASVRVVDARGKPLRAGRSPAHLEVVLTPGASFADLVSGSVNDTKQSPLMADSIMVANLDRERYSELKIDRQGRMTFPTLIPGATYRIVVLNQPVKTQIEFTVKPREAKDLGELVIRNVDQAG
jgi:beta-lactamase regulating signal transducer with metallopeptidase domain